MQPASFAVMVSLAALWRQHGVEPDALVGHSQGEIAAAHVAGALTLEDAARIIVARAQAMVSLAGAGGMVALGLAAAEVEELIAPWEGRIALAVTNSPRSASVSGEPEALAELLAACEQRDVRTRMIMPEHASHWDRLEAARERLLADLAPIAPGRAELPLFSGVLAAEIEGEELVPEYWYRGMRERLRFDATVAAMLAAGFDRFIEVSPHPLLTLAVQENAEAAGAEVATIGTLRRDESDLARFTAALAEAHAHGVAVDWPGFFAPQAPKRVPLPTYAFQRQRYWLESGSGRADLGAAGLGDPDHPLLAAATALPSSAGEGLLLSGRLSLQSHPWLGDHRVFGTAILPGTAFLELALAAAERCGAEEVAELTIQAPLVLPEQGAVALQVRVGAPDAAGARTLAIHSRGSVGKQYFPKEPRDSEGTEGEWTLNASGSLGPASGEVPRDLSEWPPAGAEPLEIADLYERTAAIGLDYGPAFQGASAAWQRGEAVFVEAELDPEQAAAAGRFGLHPALLDAAFHPGLAVEAERRQGAGEPKVPFAWSGVRLHRSGAARLRLAIDPPQGETTALTVADRDGQPLASVRAVTSRPLAPAALAGSDPQRDALFAIEWAEAALPAPGEDAAAVLTLARDPELDAAAAASALCAQALAALQEAIAAGEGRLAILTAGAVAASAAETPDPAAAAVWGLVRSAQAEHPGRFTLIDSDATEASAAALAAALAPGAEAQIALREGTALSPRLARAAAGEAVEPAPLDPERTVLITGGTGALGSLLARHLVAAHGACHLLLTSRRGPEAPGAAALAAELEEQGAKVTLAACDVAEREQLAALLDSIPAAHPLGAVFHAAATFDNALIESLDEQQLRRVLDAKAGAAWSLHELTREAELSDFVLFSSTAGSFDNPGQGNYAAANAFLDALARRRHAAGLAAKSIAWGVWEQEVGGPSELIVDSSLARLLRAGFVRMPAAQGLELLERTRALATPFVIAAALDLASLRGEAARGELPPLYAGLLRVPARRAAPAAGALGERLAAAPESEREGIVLGLVAEHVAAILGHESGAAIDPGVPFKDLGFDSLAAVELRNRLGEVTGLTLPSTLVFDHPTAAAAAAFVRGLAEGESRAPARVRAVAASAEPIAIVGMSCRYPGGVRSPRELWQLLAAGGEAISPFPEDRGWDLERLLDPDPDHPDTSYASVGGFLDDAADFDAAFFGISPREARLLDPQLRLAQEAAWEVLEDAGIDPDSLRGSATGVFAGAMHHDYTLVAGGSGAASGFEGATSGGSAVSGRIAYALGLEGPAVTVDTACSSSLVAMHLAAQALHAGECDLALAGGTSVSATPGMFTMFSRQRGLAPDGRCKPFAAAADGTGISEGVGLVLLERLSEAERNGHEVLALLRGSATNQDGASNGITAPNGPAQERVIMQALVNAGLEPSEVDVVEAHGTGTTLGDPIEAQAILATYGQEREQPLRLGSIKSNLGHTQAAAGVAGVIKMALALREGLLPRTLHVDEPTPHVDWSAGAVELATEAEPWEPNGHPRRAGVSSFGLSGTNAHVIIEEAPRREPVAEGSGESGPELPAIPLAVSAKTAEALPAQAKRLIEHLRENPDLDLRDVGFSLATTRAALEHRAVATGADREELLEALAALAAEKPHPSLVQGRAATGKLAFLFSGQGAQRAGMGKELYESFPRFAEALDEICAELDTHLDRDLKELLFADEGSDEAALLDRTEFTQPALFALEVALYRQLEAFGLKPDYLLGHSIGELAAAHVAGVFDLKDACKLIAARGSLMGALPEGGAMVAIEASEQEVAEDLPDGLSIAGINSPTSVVVSGEEKAALQFGDAWKDKGRKTTRLRVSHAFHSELMEPMLEEFAEVAKTISFAEPKVTVLSNLTGEPLTAEQATDPAYWVAQVRQAVRFADGATYLAEQGATTLVELGPDGVLCAMAQGSFLEQDKEAVVVPALRKDRPEPDALLGALASAHANGAAFDWSALFPNAKRVPLPTYAFQRQRYWLEARSDEADVAAAGQSASEHPLLPAAISLPDGGHLLTGRLSLKTHPWLADHAVHGTVLLPGAAFVEMALKAAELAGVEGIEELTIEAPLVLPEQGAVQVQVSVGAEEDGSRQLSIHSRIEDPDDPEGEWATNASGTLGTIEADAPEPLIEWPPAGAEPISLDSFYEQVADLGADYGPSFQNLRSAWRQGEELFAEVELDPERVGEAERFGIHPALLDAALHASLADGEEEGAQGPKVPFAWSGVRLHRAGAAKLRVAIGPAGPDAGSLRLADAAGEPVVTVAALVAREIPASQLGAQAQADSLFAIEWTETAPQSNAEPAAVVELSADPNLDPPTAAQRLCEEVLAWLQGAIVGEDEERLAFLSSGAVAIGEDETPDPALAAALGMIRSAQAEHPGRFALIDTDGSEDSKQALEQALTIDAEPQLALREGTVLVPRLTRAVQAKTEEPTPLDPERTVLITGATGALGALFARHLVSEHGARHLLLVSRRGPEAPGAPELAAELEEQGAKVTLAACDAADREQLQSLLDSIPTEHPLGAVFHAAGVVDDGVLESLTPQRIETTMAPKATAAWNLHELTKDLELSEFVLFSSVAASLGNPGQGNYAAANAFLDALAQQRNAEGLAGRAIAWGAWATASEMTAGLDAADLARLGRGGIAALSPAEGLALFERSRASAAPLLLAANLEKKSLRAAARAGELAPLFSGLVRVPARAAAPGGSLAQRLATAPEAEHEGIARALVAEHVAAVLGHASAAAIDVTAPFQDLGFDSLAAVELRNRLGRATGLRLPSTLVFDHPTTTAVGAFLVELARGRSGGIATVRVAARSEEPIAIVGMSCRYPGGVRSPDDLWRLLTSGGDGISAFPDDRGWPLDRLFDPDRPGSSYVSESGFLHDAGEFDAAFFGISPREALATDPQQRLLLEAAWEALESAGLDPTSLAGSAAGVFAGLMHHDYGLAAATPDGQGEAALAIGSAVSGRISYALGFEGPAVTVDTACSSSLVAMHLAAQALRSGECDLALAGGVTVMATPWGFVEFSRQRGLAPDGRCKSFAGAADGTAWSEGVGLLVLERLSEAERNGHEVLALLRGSATNQDGASNGLTAPNGPSQERVILQALANAGLEPSEVDAVEAHGTGTTLGDPIEAQALLATYGQDREDGPLRLGTIKSNFGHTQAAAGVAGVIKMTLALREGLLPRTLNVDEPTPHVDWDAGAVKLLTEAEPWERGERPRRAGVSSFGISGTNAHVIIEEAPATEASTAPEADDAPRPPLLALPVSARGDDALREQARRLADHLRAHPDLDLRDVGFSLATTRAALEHRAVATGADREELLEALDALASEKPHPGLVLGRAGAGKLAFLFSGQGAQRAGMGKELYESFPRFAEALDEICAELDSHLDRDLKKLLFADEGSDDAALLDRTEFTQPALFALEVALYRQLESFGLKPDYLLGHSIGELSAAHVAGVFDLPDACKLIAARGALMGALPKGGAMVAIEASEAEVAADLPEGLSIAGINSPTSVVVSGEEKAALEFGESWKGKGRKTTRLRVSHAFHSELMEPMLTDFEAVAKTIAFAEPKLTVLSNLTGEPLTAEQATDPAYWVAQVRQAVRFADGATYLADQGATILVELGPDGVLCAMAQGAFVEQGKEAVAVPVLRREREEPAALLSALTSAHSNGAPVDWSALFPNAKRVPLPTYAFQRQRYWLEARSDEADVAAAGQSASEHPLLPAAISLPDGGHLLTGRLSLKTHPWLADHAVHGTVILPGAAFVEMALKAVEQAGSEGIEELTIEAPLVLPEQGAIQVQVSVGAEEDGSRSLSIHSRPEDHDDPEGEWATNASGTLGTVAADQAEPLTEWPPAGAEPISLDSFYEQVADLGADYGPSFQNLRAAWRQGEELFVEVELDPERISEAERFAIHPALLETALAPALLGGEEAGVRQPLAWSGVALHGAGAVQLRAALSPTEGAEGSFELRIASTAGEPLATARSLTLRPLAAEEIAGADVNPHRDSLFELTWSELDLPRGSAAEAGVHAPEIDPGLDPAAAAIALCEQALTAMREAIAAEDRVAFLTEGAVAATAGEIPDPAAAALWGLVRSAQAEHPGRFLLIDTDGSEASAASLEAAVAQAAEPQLALREGVALAPRLTRPADAETPVPTPLDPERTVLITGASGALGAPLAHHLVAEHGARRLLLVSRKGAEAPGAGQLAAALEALGAAVEIAACDVAERPALAALLDAIPAEHPLGAVFHLAGALDDGLLESLDRERLERAMLAKAEGAWNLHELTREAALSDFVLYSSLAGTLGVPGQGNHAAASAFLDALAQRRRADGLPASSIAWGPWEAPGGEDRALRRRPRPRRPRRRAAARHGRRPRPARPPARPAGAVRPRRRPRPRRPARPRPRRRPAAAALRPGPRPRAARRRRRRLHPPPRGRPRGGAPRPGAGPGRGPGRDRARSRHRHGDRPRRPLQGPRLRLAGGGRTAQPARHRDRRLAADRPSSSTTRTRPASPLTSAAWPSRRRSLPTRSTAPSTACGSCWTRSPRRSGSRPTRASARCSCRGTRPTPTPARWTGSAPPAPRRSSPSSTTR